MKLDFKGRYKYKTPRYPLKYGECELLITHDELRHYVIATELADNPGASIINAIKALAEQVKNEFNLGAYRWFERSLYDGKFSRFEKGRWFPATDKEREIISQIMSP